MTSAARIPKLEPAALDEDQRALYDAIAGGRRAQGPQLFRLADSEGRLEGPFNAFLLQPRLGSALQALGSAVRYDTRLDDRCREIAILIVAAHWESEFEWYAHEAVGRSVGLGDAELAAVRDGRYTELTAARDGPPPPGTAPPPPGTAPPPPGTAPPPPGTAPPPPGTAAPPRWPYGRPWSRARSLRWSLAATSATPSTARPSTT